MNLDPQTRSSMGRRAREVVEVEFSEDLVERAYVQALAEIARPHSSGSANA